MEFLYVFITCEKANFNIVGKSGDDFSYLPMIEREEPVILSQFTLKEMIRQTIFSISDNDTNKLMTGELFEINEDELKILDYRSKLELTEDVRIVEIDGVDVCACCAPHVNSTAEVGIIKLLDFMKHRGGVRIVMKAGSLALKDYREKYRNALGISNLLSVKQHDIFTATEKFYNDLGDERRKFYEYRLSVAERDKENLIDIIPIDYQHNFYHLIHRWLLNHI